MGLEARVSVGIVAVNQTMQILEAVVDTGFEGAITLPDHVAREMGLHTTGTRPITLASGQTIQTDTCIARLLWHGQPEDTRAYMMGDTSLIGTTLLAESRLSIDWWDGGDVVIEERMPPGG